MLFPGARQNPFASPDGAHCQLREHHSGTAQVEILAKPEFVKHEVIPALGGDPDAGLQVLTGLSSEAIKSGKQMLADSKVNVGIADVPYILYSEARASKGQDWVRVCIANLCALAGGGMVHMSRQILEIMVNKEC